MSIPNTQPRLLDAYNRIARAALDSHLAAEPRMRARLSVHDKERYVAEAGNILRLLHDSLAEDDPGLLGDYLARRPLRVIGRTLPEDAVVQGIEHLKAALGQYLPRYMDAGARAVLDSALGMLDSGTPTDAPEPEAHSPLPEGLQEAYLSALLRGDRARAQALVEDALDAGYDIRDIYTGVFARTQGELGNLRRAGRMSLSNEQFVTAATQLIIANLYPRILAMPRARNGKRLVTACIEGEQHEFGIRMVADFFELDGWDTRYLGSNQTEAGIIGVLEQCSPEVFAVACTMIQNLPALSSLIRAIRRSPELRDTRVIVGGYPFKAIPGLWRSVGADACAEDAPEAVRLGTMLTSGEGS